MNRTLGARELKMRLGTYLREVQEGATIVITEHGRPVAELRPLPKAATEEEARLDELAALGILRRGAAESLAAFEPVRISGAPLSQTLLDDREDRF
jgi:prevent-host-death family protein